MNEVITLGGGCFWCTEAVFQRIKGVDTVVSGYMGGSTKNPSYMEVCTGLTGHVEVIQIAFQPNVVSLKELLEIFFMSHDPTTLNRQGADEGTQYKSVVFYENETQKQIILDVIKEFEVSKILKSPIVTEVTPSSIFYPAEIGHQNYYNLNSSQPYCTFVISPKIHKVEKLFKEQLK
ncbi:MAG: peptide-methionine (S)-S-oxide reductase MsrA [Chitinophagales bacterium]|nr:peptide-methionine (S)-S-oxide reductase MsrA [Chitinophagales bacterium]